MSPHTYRLMAKISMFLGLILVGTIGFKVLSYMSVMAGYDPHEPVRDQGIIYIGLVLLGDGFLAISGLMFGCFAWIFIAARMFKIQRGIVDESIAIEVAKDQRENQPLVLHFYNWCQSCGYGKKPDKTLQSESPLLTSFAVACC